MKCLNRILFGVVLLGLLVMSIFSDSTFFFYEIDKPWQLNPFAHEDSLCQYYKDNYKIYDSRPIIATKVDTTKSLVVILVDAWGVHLERKLMQQDFAIFPNGKNVEFGIHKRLANRNTHAEGVELKKKYENATYYFGGDSTEYDGRQFMRECVKEMVFCQNCGDDKMLTKLDSAISDTSISEPRFIAWTTQTSRDGNRENLHKTLAGIAKLMQKHPEMQFVIQGTHRPILGTPETRRMYHAHWVPVVVINATK